MDQMEIYKNLIDKGYILIKSFISKEELDFLEKDFNSQKGTGDNKNYNLPMVSADAIDKLREKMTQITSDVSKIGINATLLHGGAYFCTEGGQEFTWHQDHESYFACQNHYDYLNFYIPVIKPDKTKSNISIVPFDVLKEKLPELHDKVIYKGAIHYDPTDENGMEAVDDNIGKVIHTIDFDLNEIAVTEELEPGDLLLMRGDLVHHTQDTETYRVAASIRSVCPDQLVSYRKLIKGCATKTELMSGNRWVNNYMINAFIKNKKEEITVKDFLTADLGVFNITKEGKKLSFVLRLYYLKIKLFFTDLLGLKPV